MTIRLCNCHEQASPSFETTEVTKCSLGFGFSCHTIGGSICVVGGSLNPNRIQRLPEVFLLFRCFLARIKK
jgi:hypothetical protein